ncbi:hypothetical protein ACIP5Y_33140 [Nocardia sp. NPDC088792]|uniref:hypothetical protein n=1 Tax=Nocardia sp. NPDC088792 TaxID=3364332 RepID=UPI00381D14CA
MGLRKIAPEFMASLEATDTAADALRISRQFQDQQLLKQIDTYGQRTGLPPTHIGTPNPPHPDLPAIHPAADPKIPPQREVLPQAVPYSDAAARNSVIQDFAVTLEGVPAVSPGIHVPLDSPFNPQALPDFNEWRLPSPDYYAQWSSGSSAGDGISRISPSELRFGGVPLVKDAQAAIARTGSDDLRIIQKMLDQHGEDVAGLLHQYGIKGRKSIPEFDGVDDVVARLNESLANLAEVRRRGYPYLFDSKKQFDEVKSAILDVAGKRGVDPADVEVVVQGSSLHKLTAGDIDIALVVDAETFERYGRQFLENATLDKVAKQIGKDVKKGKLPANRWAPREGSDNLGVIMYETLANGAKIQISLMKEGGEYLVAPYLR